MQLISAVAACLEADTAQLLKAHSCEITEIRLRTNRPVQICCLNGLRIQGQVLTAETLQIILNRLMRNSLYACEQELKQGYFTAEGGCRVGVCGKLSTSGDHIESMAAIASACIRIPRELPGSADDIYEFLFAEGVQSFLVISPPGKGKTTLLREIIRRLSNEGANIAVADERREIAGCFGGIPDLDVGLCTDVLDGYPKVRAVSMLVRSCAPEMIAVDEIGSPEEAEAILDAARCGVKTAATVHAASFEDASVRKGIKALLDAGVFQYCLVLGPGIGEIGRILLWKDGGYRDVEGSSAFGCTSGLHGNRSGTVRRAQAQV